MPMYSRKRDYVRIAENALGHELPIGAVVHHVDRDRKNNRNDNLVILQSLQEHAALHRRLRVLRAGGNPWTQHVCATCKAVKDLTEFPPRSNRLNGRSQECRACTKERRHRIWCEKNGRPNVYETPEQRSARNREMARRRWAA